jgi:hypothetical protein
MQVPPLAQRDLLGESHGPCVVWVKMYIFARLMNQFKLSRSRLRANSLSYEIFVEVSVVWLVTCYLLMMFGDWLI